MTAPPGMVFPNPVHFDVAVRKTIKFGSLCKDSKVFIYSVRGEIIRQMDSPGEWKTLEWDGTNDVGNKCPTGMYLYVITFPKNCTAFPEGKVFKGKIGIIR